MAIIGPDQLPVVLRVDSNPIKFEALSTLGHPVVQIEIEEPQLEQAIRVTGDFIAGYFPLEQRYAFFMTEPLRNTYPIPEDAYWIQDVKWDPVTTRIDDIFGAESFLFNIGNITGIQNLLTDWHLLQAYRKFSQRILATEGMWEFKGDNKIRLYPTPRGSFPVVVEYIPSVYRFKSTEARELTKRMLVAELKIMLGNIRGKYASGIPAPDGGAMSLNGSDLLTQGQEEKKELVEEAIKLAEPLQFYLF
jgi:hypothetical protein